jgi:N-acetylglutamate synthase-like GNAT family acetyltransferase
MKIRKFKESDAKAVCKIIRTAIKTCYSSYYSKEIITIMCKHMNPKNFKIRAKERKYFVAEEKGKVIGIGGFKDNEIKTFYIDIKSHKKGIGKKLIEKLEQEALKNNYKTLKVTSSLFAEGFYKKCGFKKIKKIKIHLKDKLYRRGVYMTKILNT